MEIVIERLDRNGRMTERRKHQGPQLIIGRSYRSDLILSDPHVCPQHLLLRFDAESNGWQVRDLSSQNGTFQVGVGRLERTCELRSGDTFDLGTTRIRLLLPDHEIPPTRKLPTGRMLADYVAMPVVTLALLVIVLGLYALMQTLSMGTEIKEQELLLEALTLLAVPFVWACVWGMIGRVAVHDVRFSFHLSIGALIVLGEFGVAVLADWLGFGFSSETLALWLENLGEGMLLCAVLVASLWAATHMSRAGRWLLANALAWALVGVGLLSYWVDADPYATQGQQAYRLKPPFARMQPVQSLDTFMGELDGVFVALDQDDS